MANSPEVSFIVPCYNEAARLLESTRTLALFLSQQDLSYEIIYVDDGSSDATADILTTVCSKDIRARLIRLPNNRGKGGAVRAGVLGAQGKYCIFFDADLAFSLEQIDRLLTPLRAGAQIVVGVRQQDPGNPKQPLLRRLSSSVFRLATRTIVGIGASDSQCGFKGFATPFAKSLFSATQIDGFGFDVELLAVAEQWGKLPVEVPVVAEHREGSSVRLVRDVPRMIRELWRVRTGLSHNAYPPDKAPPS